MTHTRKGINPNNRLVIGNEGERWIFLKRDVMSRMKSLKIAKGFFMQIKINPFYSFATSLF
jgi:hypothetical protein